MKAFENAKCIAVEESLAEETNVFLHYIEQMVPESIGKRKVEEVQTNVVKRF